MSTVAVSGAYAAEKMNQYNLSEVVVEAERGNLAGGMMQTRQTVGMFLGEKDTLDVPLHEVTFTKYLFSARQRYAGYLGSRPRCKSISWFYGY